MTLGSRVWTWSTYGHWPVILSLYFLASSLFPWEQCASLISNNNLPRVCAEVNPAPMSCHSSHDQGILVIIKHAAANGQAAGALAPGSPKDGPVSDSCGLSRVSLSQVGMVRAGPPFSWMLPASQSVERMKQEQVKGSLWICGHCSDVCQEESLP